MYLLDTDTTSNFLAQNRNYTQLRERILSEPLGAVYISIFTVEEMFRGQLAQINSARSRNDPGAVVKGYELLQTLYEALQCFPTLPFNSAADELMERIDRGVRRKHGADCRIAAIASARGFTVVTRNTQDYDKIGLARNEDWA